MHGRPHELSQTCLRSFSTLFFREQLEINRVAHGLIAAVGRMKMITAVGRCREAGYVLGIARCAVPIDHTVKFAAGTNPVVDGLTVSIAFRRIVVRSFIGEDRRSIYTNVVSVSAKDDLLVGADHLFESGGLLSACLSAR